MNARFTLLTGALLLTQFSAAQSQFGGPVQFYFSTPGGDNSRLHNILVDSANWTGEVDVVVKNVGSSVVTFGGAYVHVGYGLSTAYGSSAIPTAGSDLVRERSSFPQFQHVRDNPNLTWRPGWSPGASQSWNGGGFVSPLSGPVRPWGLTYEVENTNLAPTLTLSPGESMALSRVALRDNGLFARGGSFDMVLHRWPFGQTATNTLIRATGPGSDAVYYWDSGDYIANSKLTFVTPEPVSICSCIVGLSLLACRRRRSR